MNYREHLSSSVAYLAPAKALEGLATEDAERRLSGATHSIAEIVAHMAFWQDWFLARCLGHCPASGDRPLHLALGLSLAPAA